MGHIEMGHFILISNTFLQQDSMRDSHRRDSYYNVLQIRQIYVNPYTKQQSRRTLFSYAHFDETFFNYDISLHVSLSECTKTE